MADEEPNRRLIFISGLSGAGKSVVLHTLEDLGFYCIDNLPISFLDRLLDQIESLPERIAIGIDSRNLAGELGNLPEIINLFKQTYLKVNLAQSYDSEDTNSNFTHIIKKFIIMSLKTTKGNQLTSKF